MDSRRRGRRKSPEFTKPKAQAQAHAQAHAQAQESISPVERRLGRVLQDFDLINVNVLAGHRL